MSKVSNFFHGIVEYVKSHVNLPKMSMPSIFESCFKGKDNAGDVKVTELKPHDTIVEPEYSKLDKLNLSSLSVDSGVLAEDEGPQPSIGRPSSSSSDDYNVIRYGGSAYEIDLGKESGNSDLYSVSSSEIDKYISATSDLWFDNPVIDLSPEQFSLYLEKMDGPIEPPVMLVNGEGMPLNTDSST